MGNLIQVRAGACILSVVLAGAAGTGSSAAALEQCSGGECPATARQVGKGIETSTPSLVQKRSVVEHGVATHANEGGKGKGEGRSWGSSDCAERLNHWSTRPAACVVVRGDQALLVRVPYGRNHGWDLPGGYHHEGEAACATAEREVCEETGYSVRALERLSDNTFRCEVTGSNVCTEAVDEGFLEKAWFRLDQLRGLRMRGGTWGDKLGMLREQLRAASPSPAPGQAAEDACGCSPGVNGWSTTDQRCSSRSETSPQEAIECRQKSGDDRFDVCGCRRGAEGWSSTSGSCSATSETSPEEAASCAGTSLLAKS